MSSPSTFRFVYILVVVGRRRFSGSQTPLMALMMLLLNFSVPQFRRSRSNHTSTPWIGYYCCVSPPTAALKFRGGRLLLSTFSIHGYGDIDGTRGGRMSGYSDDFSTRLYRIFIVYIYRLYRPPIMGTIAVLLFLPLLYIVLCFYFATPILGSYALQFSRGMWYHSNNGSSFCLLESDFLFCPLSTGDADWRATSWYFEYLLW